jgi:hypothetical protein
MKARPLPAQSSRSDTSMVFNLGADPTNYCNSTHCCLNCNEQTVHSKLLTFEVPTSCGTTAKVLLDCGSTTNFISQRFVSKNHVTTVPAAKSQVVKLADGSTQLIL